MDVFANSLAGLGAFLLYFSLSLAFLMLFKFVYVRFTPHDEWKLVKDQQNIVEFKTRDITQKALLTNEKKNVTWKLK